MQAEAAVYEWIRLTRSGVLRYCRRLPSAALTREVTGFGLGSVRNALVHTADCYRFWLADLALGEESPRRYRYEDYMDADAVTRLFDDVDALMGRFLGRWGAGMDEVQTLSVRWQTEPLAVTPRWLFTHVTTHEFHHKGQLVSMGRALGHEPPETDLSLPPSRS